MTDLHPLHWSWAQQGVSNIRPRRMDTCPMSPQEKEVLTKIALDIFADMANANQGFQSALLAVYLSGIHHGLKAIAND